jgi:hypothetical protein
MGPEMYRCNWGPNENWTISVSSHSILPHYTLHLEGDWKGDTWVARSIGSRTLQSGLLPPASMEMVVACGCIAEKTTVPSGSCDTRFTVADMKWVWGDIQKCR